MPPRHNLRCQRAHNGPKDRMGTGDDNAEGDEHGEIDGKTGARLTYDKKGHGKRRSRFGAMRHVASMRGRERNPTNQA